MALLVIPKSHAWALKNPSFGFGGSSYGYDGPKFEFGITGQSTNMFVGWGIGLIEQFSLGWIEDEETAYKVYRYIPRIGWQIPVTIDNSVPEGHVKMGSPWRRTFSNPFKKLGDFNIGLSMSYDNMNTPFGFYVHAKYKSTEVIMKDDNVMDSRAHYFEPGAGLRLLFGKVFVVEAGASYDYAFKYRGEWDKDGTKVINSGVCGDLGIGLTIANEGFDKRASFLLKYQHPFYNYFNKDYTPDDGITYPYADTKRKVGYFTFMFRYGF